MSNLNNKHLPSDISSLTRKDLVEFSKIQMEEYKKLLEENEQLKAELATAKAELDELGEQCRKVVFYKRDPLREQEE